MPFDREGAYAGVIPSNRTAVAVVIPFRPRAMARAPSPAEVVLALHRLLQKHGFASEQDIRARQMGPRLSPSYVVVLGTHAAPTLEKVLAPILGSRSHLSATHWVLYPADVTTIWEAAG
jgi:hypothetical protein